MKILLKKPTIYYYTSHAHYLKGWAQANFEKTKIKFFISQI